MITREKGLELLRLSTGVDNADFRENQWEAIELDTGLDWIRNDKNVREMIDVYVLKGAR